MKLKTIIAKYNGGREAAQDLLDVFDYEYFDYYPEKRKIYETSCTKAAKDAMEYFNIPEERTDVFDALSKVYGKLISDSYNTCPYWYNIEGVRFRASGEWGVSYIEYNGHAMPDSLIEDGMYDMYKSDCEEEGVEIDQDDFAQFMLDHADEVKEWMLWDGCPEY